MTQDEMWKAVCENDASCDGLFFYAVRSTGIYCRPSCKSKRPKRKNVCFFNTARQAENAGFRPCKRCRSDLSDYRPIRETAEQAKRTLDDSFGRTGGLNQKWCQMAVSRRRLAEIFQEEYGVTPSEYLSGLRLAKAKRLLAGSERPIMDIAFSAGFGGLSSFYRFFKKETGLSPAAYRREHQA